MGAAMENSSSVKPVKSVVQFFGCGFAVLRVPACVGFSMRFADGPEDDGGRFNGAGTPRPAFNHSILHQLSMLYDSIAASMPFSACFDHFSVKSTQVTVHELFTRKTEALKIKLNNG